ncbi:MAG: hypothetical protein Q9193_003721 [Seirophora villosa]
MGTPHGTFAKSSHRRPIELQTAIVDIDRGHKHSSLIVMAELALAVNIIEVMKLTYRVAHFIYGSIEAAKTEDAEKAQIASNFRLEFLFLASFKRYLEKNHNSIAYDKALDELWLLEIEQVISHMKQDFSEYEIFVEKDGSETLEPSTSSLPLLSRQNGQKLDAASDDKSFPMNQKWRDGHRRVYKKAKWALFDRQQLENIVEKFRKRNKTLRKILQFAMAGILQQTAQHGQGLKSLQKDQDAVALGLTTWAEIKQIKDQPERIDKDFSLSNCTVDTTDEAFIIRPGTLFTTAHTNSNFSRDKLSKESVLVEYKTYDAAAEGLSNSDKQGLEERIDRRVKQLAGLLSTAGSNSLGTLPFKGFFKEADKSRYAFIFSMPDSTTEAKPDSLHQMIENPVLGRLWTLSDRFSLAGNLARIMGTFHMFEWVLKGFRSDSVVFCTDMSSSKPQLSKPFVAGFEYIRPVSGSTVGQPLDMSEKTTLYCHPDLQDGLNIEFGKIHDLYSLGVVLLEIGLWTSARQIVQQARPLRPSRAGDIREEYIRKAKSKLPLRMGRSFADVVVACLDSRHKHQAIRPEFLNVFDDSIVQKLSAKQLLE